MGINEIRKASQLGPVSMFDFAGSYLIVIIIWMIGLVVCSWSGLTLIGMLLSVLPLAIASHIYISSNGTKLSADTKKTALTDMFLANDCKASTIAVKTITYLSAAGALGIFGYNIVNRRVSLCKKNNKA
jgi:hypothetical protein